MSAYAGQTALPGGWGEGCFCCPVEHRFALGRAVLATRSGLKAIYVPLKSRRENSSVFPPLQRTVLRMVCSYLYLTLAKQRPPVQLQLRREGHCGWVPCTQKDGGARQHPSQSGCWGCKAQLCTESSCWDQPDMAWFCARRFADIYRAFHRQGCGGTHVHAP